MKSNIPKTLDCSKQAFFKTRRIFGIFLKIFQKVMGEFKMQPYCF